MMYSTDTSQTGDVMDIYIVIIVILAVIALVAILAPVTVKYGEGTEAANEEEIVAKGCKRHSHSFWYPYWDGWVPKIERQTHVWRCTSEKCPLCGQPCTQTWHLQ